MTDLQALVDGLIGSDAARRFFLVLVRLTAIVSLSPVFGGEILPKRVRLSLAILFALALAPPVPDSVGTAIPTGAAFGALVAKEAFIGLVFAVFLRVAFDLLAAAGAIMDVARGASMASLLDPLAREQRSILSSFLMQVILLLFLAADGHEVLLRSLARSLLLAPPEAPLVAGLRDLLDARALLGLVGGLFLTAVQAAAPIVAVIFLLDIALALLARAAPQIQVYFLGLATKGVLGLFVLLIVFRAVVPRLVRTTLDTMNDLIGGG